MASIGFEWQFNDMELRFQQLTKGNWKSITLPSKALVHHWRKPGVRIESDSGEVEIITDPVKTWEQLLPQLVLIGEILLAVGGVMPDWGELADDRNLRFAMSEAGLGSGLVVAQDAESRRPTRAATTRNANQYPQGIELVDGHLRKFEADVDNAEIRLDKGVGDGLYFLDFALADPIFETVEVTDAGVESAQTLVRRGEHVAVVGVRQSTPLKGFPQCTMEVSLADLTERIKYFSPSAVMSARDWLANDVNVRLKAFMTLLFYYRERFASDEIKTEKEGPKAVFNLFPRMNVRSVYRTLLTDDDRQVFDAKLAAMMPLEKNVRMCPQGYKAGNDSIDNKLTWYQWLDSIRRGDQRPAVTLLQDYSGEGPRGADYDLLSPPQGYPAHQHAARTMPWFTYAMGRANVDPAGSVLLVEYRDTLIFQPTKAKSIGYTSFLLLAAKAARSAGLIIPEAPAHYS